MLRRRTDAAAVQTPIGSIINRSVAHVSELMTRRRGPSYRARSGTHDCKSVTKPEAVLESNKWGHWLKNIIMMTKNRKQHDCIFHGRLISRFPEEAQRELFCVSPPSAVHND